jgi:hypothetical protein
MIKSDWNGASENSKKWLKTGAMKIDGVGSNFGH